jgi:hypothetical protein
MLCAIAVRDCSCRLLCCVWVCHFLATQQWLRGQLTPLLDHSLQTILSNQASPPAAAASGGAGSTAAGAAAGRAGRQQQASLDWGAVGLAHVNAMAGTCFALGLRFAGRASAPWWHPYTMPPLKTHTNGWRRKQGPVWGLDFLLSCKDACVLAAVA